MRNEKTKGESEKAKNMKEKDTDRKTKEICCEIIHLYSSSFFILFRNLKGPKNNGPQKIILFAGDLVNRKL